MDTLKFVAWYEVNPTFGSRGIFFYSGQAIKRGKIGGTLAKGLPGSLDGPNWPIFYRPLDHGLTRIYSLV